MNLANEIAKLKRKARKQTFEEFNSSFIGDKLTLKECRHTLESAYESGIKDGEILLARKILETLKETY